MTSVRGKIKREDQIKSRMENFGETRAEAEDFIDWVEKEFSKDKLRPVFRKLIGIK